MQLNVMVRALGFCACVCACVCVRGGGGLVIAASSPEQPERGIVHGSRGTARPPWHCEVLQRSQRAAR